MVTGRGKQGTRNQIRGDLSWGSAFQGFSWGLALLGLSIALGRSQRGHSRRVALRSRSHSTSSESGTLFGRRRCSLRAWKSHGARPVHQVILMIRWIWTDRLSINDSPSTSQAFIECPISIYPHFLCHHTRVLTYHLLPTISPLAIPAFVPFLPSTLVVNVHHPRLLFNRKFLGLWTEVV